MRIGHVTLIVKDYEQALDFYVGKLGFTKQQDTKFWGDQRWVTISPKDQPDFELTFVLADSDAKQAVLGKQAGDHVLFTLDTDDCIRDYKAFSKRGVKFYDEPTTQPWGTEVVFEDLYGNLFDLVQRSKTYSKTE